MGRRRRTPFVHADSPYKGQKLIAKSVAGFGRAEYEKVVTFVDRSAEDPAKLR
jgi:hypothetical protein